MNYQADEHIRVRYFYLIRFRALGPSLHVSEKILGILFFSPPLRHFSRIMARIGGISATYSWFNYVDRLSQWAFWLLPCRYIIKGA